MINPFYAKVGIVGGASEVIASGLMYKALNSTRHENIATSMSYISGPLIFAFLYRQTRVIPPKSDIYTSSLVFFGAIILQNWSHCIKIAHTKRRSSKKLFYIEAIDIEKYLFMIDMISNKEDNQQIDIFELAYQYSLLQPMFDYRKDKSRFNEFITKTCCDSEELCKLNGTKLKILGLLLCQGSNYHKSDCLYELICSKNKQNASLSWNNRHYYEVLNQLLEVSLQIEVYYTEKPEIACYKSA